jgi:hypothetical protein
VSASPLAESMAEAATAFLADLTAEQQAAATREFTEGGERLLWYYTPNARPGVSLIELGPAQRQAARKLLHTGLSEGGYNTAATIMGLEAILGAKERFDASHYPGYRGPTPSVVRDPEMYFVCIFGAPGDARWGWAFGGHHVSVHHTVVDGQVARATPSFLGANPAKASLGGAHFLRPLAPEEDLAFALLGSLSDGQRRVAMLGPRAPSDLMQANRPVLEDGATPLSLADLMGTPDWANRQRAVDRSQAHSAQTVEELEPLRFRLVEPRGLALSACDEAQRELAGRLIRRYLDRLPEEFATQEWRRVQPTLPVTHFAWAGPGEPGTSHYYRLHGPAILIEYDNTDARGNHIHAVWRDPAGDFGADLLAAHYAASHR